MIIIGERINASRPAIQKALEEKDVSFIREEAKNQAAQGADYLDINCGLSQAAEEKDIEWLVLTVRSATDTPLCIDSPNPGVVERGVALGGPKCLINSITAERSRYEKILPLALKSGCGLIALTMDDKGMPATADDRVRIAEGLYGLLKKEGMADENIYFDPLVQPIATEQGQAMELLSTIPRIKRLGGVKVVCSASNVSFGLPKRRLLNSIFLALCLEAGLDGAIIDPLDKLTLGAVRSAEALLGRDKYCRNFIQGHRKGLFGHGRAEEDIHSGYNAK